MNEENIQKDHLSIDELIGQLPDHFPSAVHKIKSEIIPHLVNCDPAVRYHYIKIIKKQTNAASIKSVSMLIEEAINEIESSDADLSQDPSNDPVVDLEIIEAAEQIANDPMLFKKKIAIVNQMGVVGERTNIGLYQLVIDSRLLPKGCAGSEALAMKNCGHYGAGKSFPLFTALRLYPHSAFHLISSGSEKSLYSIEGGLQHKALILAEALALESHGGKDNELAYAIRTLVSEGQLKYQTTGYVDKRPVTILKEIAGPTSLVTTTIKGKLEDQLDDRMINAHPNTSATQTRDIIERTADMASGNGVADDEKTIKSWQRFHEFLVSGEVMIPYAKDIALIVNRNGSLPISARRSFKRILAAIKTITLLHQKQRATDEQGRFIAEFSDYAIAYQLMKETFAESLGDAKKYTDDRIVMIEAQGRMSPKALSEKFNVSTAAISQWLKPLIEKSVLAWCDETGAEFRTETELEKAKRLGKAYLFVVGGNSLPTLFQLTGDPRWDKKGDLYVAYDLNLDDVPEELVTTENIIGEPVQICDDGECRENDGQSVKALSEKTHAEVLKMVECPRKDKNEPTLMDMVKEFENILSPARYELVN
jgi:hypothetical protein